VSVHHSVLDAPQQAGHVADPTEGHVVDVDHRNRQGQNHEDDVDCSRFLGACTVDNAAHNDSGEGLTHSEENECKEAVGEYLLLGSVWV